MNEDRRSAGSGEEPEPAPVTASAPAPAPAPPRRPTVLVVLVVAGLIVAAAGATALVMASRNPPGGSGASPTPARVVRGPADPRVATAEPFRVLLVWSSPVAETRVEGYRIYRNGALLARVDAPATSFTDSTALPKERYEYELVAYSGSTDSRPVSVTLRTPSAPLALARLEGTFDVRAKTVSSSGYSDLTPRRNFGWRFHPRCDRGPCPVRWEDLQFDEAKTTLTRKGPRYSGQVRAKFNVRCGDTETASDVTLELRVVRARAVSGEWRAVRLKGTLKHSEPAQLGCVSSSATMSFTARLVN